MLPCLVDGSICRSYTWLTLQTSNRCFFLFPKAPSGPLSAVTSVRLLSVQRIDSRQLECLRVRARVCASSVGGATAQATPLDGNWLVQRSFTPVPPMCSQFAIQSD